MKTLTLIDSFGFFFSLFHAMSSLKSNDGKPSGMVYGFANFINTLKRDFPSDYIVFALDSGGKTFRNEIDENYKANRKSPPDELKEQLPVCMDMIEKMGFCSLKVNGYEADDVIASFVKNNKNEDLQITIVTNDKDLYQLISDKVRIYSPRKKQFYDRNGCYEKYGVYPEQICDFLGIVGDTSDNIPGVKGIGDKGAKKLLELYGSIENIYADLLLVGNERTKKLLIESKDNAFKSKKLATLCSDLQTPDLQNAVFPQGNPLEKVADILNSYSLNRLISNISNTQKTATFETICINDEKTLENLLNIVNSDDLIAFDTETTGLDTKNADIVGFSFAFSKNKAYYVPLLHEGSKISKNCAKWAISQIFKAFVVGHNLKYDFAIIKNNFDLDIPQNYADTMILAWLYNPDQSVDMDTLAKKLFSHETIKFKDLVEKSQTFADVSLDTATKYAAEDAAVTFMFYEYFLDKLPKELFEIAKALEFGFIKIILNMEANGIKVDCDILQDLKNKTHQSLEKLTHDICELAGEDFNIKSTKQLSEILFDKLNLSVTKKTKTGRSTDEDALKAIINEHKIVPKLLEYREIFKLQSTYCDPILNFALQDKNNRIYTHFLQTGTATGRLASKEPNLQNIPARGGELVSAFRKAFISQNGYSLVSLDYSQIELRLLAHFSEDEKLVHAFNNSEDIHSRTAISIFGDAQSNHRAIAKSINFGLIYGMGANRLSSQIGVDKKTAQEYIEKYFANFGTIKDFLESIKNQAKLDGFVSTLLGRKRYFDFARADMKQLAMFEREAINTKFQGSAADIIKLAMNAIYPHLNEQIKLLLQIHDELIFEIKDDILDEYANKIANIMENIVKLKIPLKVSVTKAKNWCDLK